MDIIDFGGALIETEDLDPIYSALDKLDLTHSQLNKWLLGYWCFYHAGSASLLSEIGSREEYYDLMLNGNLPRGRERRHYRGELLRKSVAWMSYAGNPEDLIDYIIPEHPTPFIKFKNVIELWPGFGSWISFKAADMLERLGLAQIVFSSFDLEMYSEPKAGAELAKEDLLRRGITGVSTLSGVGRILVKEFSPYPAPPRFERPCGLQEIETILCKYKSHRSGRYAVGSDIREIRKSLEVKDWGVTSKRFLEAMPKEVTN